jgi:CheY-like chemotaxis protein
MLNLNKLLTPKPLNDVQILIVDNDRDNRELYAFVLEGCGAQVITAGSVQDGLALLNSWIPKVLICEMRFLGESVYPLICRSRHLARKHGRIIPILMTSTCPRTEFTQPWRLKTEAYLLKPVNLDDFLDEVWKLTQETELAYPLSFEC